MPGRLNKSKSGLEKQAPESKRSGGPRGPRGPLCFPHEQPGVVWSRASVVCAAGAADSSWMLLAAAGWCQLPLASTLVLLLLLLAAAGSSLSGGVQGPSPSGVCFLGPVSQTLTCFY